MSLKSSALKSIQRDKENNEKADKKDSAKKKNSIASDMFSKPSGLDTPVDRFTKMIDCDDIIPNPLNKEEMSNIEELMTSIETAGEIMHNVVVKEKDENGKYMLLAGERRWTAATRLVAEGKEQFRNIPCHIQSLEAVGEDALKMPEEWRERYLIETSNIEQRRDSSPAQTMERVDRMNALYKEMKESGFKPKGRIRELVANSLGMSLQAVAKYENVSKNATEEVKESMKAGELTLQSAMEIAKNPKETQSYILDAARKKHESSETDPEENSPITVPEVEAAVVDSFLSPKKEISEKVRKIPLPDDEVEKVINALESLKDMYLSKKGKEYPAVVYSTIEKNTGKLLKTIETISGIM